MDNSSSKPRSKRIFIALKPTLSSKFLACYKSIRSNLGEEHMKWVSNKNIHLTIKFLGDTPEFYFNSIVNSIKIASRELHEFNFTLQGVGYFGKPTPKVLWVGAGKNIALNTFRTNLDNSLSDLGFEKEKKDFTPHITLCRLKRIVSSSLLNNTIDTYKHTHFQDVSIKEIFLMESVLTPARPIYKTIKAIKL